MKENNQNDDGAYQDTELYISGKFNDNNNSTPPKESKNQRKKRKKRER